MLMNIKVIWLILLAAVLLAAVGGGWPGRDAGRREAEEMSRVIYTHPEPESTNRWRWHDSGLPEGSWFGFIADAEELATLLKERPFLAGRLPDGVNWEREGLVVASLGEAPSGGYAVRIVEVAAAGGRIHVKTAIKSPGPNDMVIQVITYPVDAVRLEKEALPAAGAGSGVTPGAVPGAGPGGSPDRSSGEPVDPSALSALEWLFTDQEGRRLAGGQWAAGR